MSCGVACGVPGGEAMNLTDPGVDTTVLAADGGSGADTLTATSYLGERLSGFGGADSLKGYSGRDTLDGGDGADTLDGWLGEDVVSGGAGDDVVLAYYDRDAITLGPGRDLVRIDGIQTLALEVPRILDWNPAEDALRFVIDGFSYAETTATDFSSAHSAAVALARSGGHSIVSVQVGADVFVFGMFSSGVFKNAIQLVGRTLDDISGPHVGLFPAPPPVEPGAAPPAPSRVTQSDIQVAGNMDAADTTILDADDVKDVTLTRIVLDGPGLDIILTGTDFSTDASRQLLYGSVTNVSLNYGPGALAVTASTMGLDLRYLVDQLDYGTTQTFFSFVFNASDRVSGSAGGDLIRAYGGNDLILGAGGSDTLHGGDGDDVIYAVGPQGGGGGSTYLRGDAGADWIAGGAGFDDINGNEGNDTAAGGVGDDWVVGGKNNDLLLGEQGHDLVYGNLGNDTGVGGDGNDVVRGGQDKDVLFGGAGDDYMSGDKGDDTVSGGAGADLFHTFGDAGLDRVLDFSAPEGDRVLLDAGTNYTVAQVGADTVVSMTGGGQMVLVGVQLSSLPQAWIFGA
jgi:Ca2+-binding RTX toxin-like protein